MNRSASGRVDRDELLARVDLRALLDALTGHPDARDRWRCPDRDHPDTHPSVTVSVDQSGVERWRCWSGGHGGTAIDAVAAAQRIGIGEAIRWLAEHDGNLPIRERPVPPPVAPLGRPAPEVALYVERAARLLWTAGGRPQRDWLTARGLNEPVLRANLVGADPGRRYLPRPRGLPGGWPAVVYPALNPTGQVAYLQARYLPPPANRSKYDNPSAQLAANPRLAWTTPVGTPLPGVLLVCEGTADALIAAQAGISAVGVLGAAYPDRRVADGIVDGRNRRASFDGSQVVVCFDADPAGRAGTARLVELLEARDVPVSTLSPPDGLDVTDWSAHDPHWHTALRSPAPAPGPPPRPVPSVPGLELSIALGGIA